MSTSSLSPTQFANINHLARPAQIFGDNNEKAVHSAINDHLAYQAGRKAAADAPVDASTEAAAQSVEAPLKAATADAAGVFKVTSLL